MNKQITLTFVLIAAFLAAGPVWSDDMMSSGVPDKATQVLSDLHQSNRNEIEMGRLAKEKGSSDQVRSYGDKVIKDQEVADQQVRDLAQKDGITLFVPATQGLLEHHAAAKEQKLMVELSHKSGADFDKAFAQVMVANHLRDISKLQKAEKLLRQADVREFVARLLPTLQEHLQMAQQLQKNS